MDFADINLNYYLALVGFTVLCYDYVLTLGMEMSRFWSPLQFSWGTVIFLLNRYVALFGHVPVMVEIFLQHHTDDVCHILHVYHQYLAIIVQILVTVIMITRNYALWGSSRKILVSLLILVAVVLAFGGWSLFSGKSDDNDYGPYNGVLGCQFAISTDQSYHMGGAWIGVVLFDSIIFALTVYKSLRLRRSGERTIVDVLLRDGSVYFAVMSITTLSNSLTYMVGRPFTRGVLTPITNVFSSVVATRLMLNIRRVRTTTLSDSLTTSSTRQDIRFTTAILNPESTFMPDHLLGHELEVLRPIDLEPATLLSAA